MVALLLLLASTLALAPADSTPVSTPVGTPVSTAGAPRRLPSPFASLPVATPDTIGRRPKAVEYSDAYATRLTIHRLASYTMLPLFGAEYILGQRLLDNSTPSARNLHGVVAGGVTALFGINTITGGWNWWESRNDPNGRTRRTVHTLLMLASDAGFVATGALASRASGSRNDALTHRNVALGSMAVATVGTGLMWFWKD